MGVTDMARRNGRAVEFPRVRVAGTAFERGRSYGAQAHDRVHTSLDAYERVFAHYAGWDWTRARDEARGFESPIAALEPAYLDEMRGIAQGAGVEFLDILALNVRTEIMFAAQARKALTSAGHPPSECTSFCLLPQASADGHLLLGENWDWQKHCFDTMVVLEAQQSPRPAFVTVVEAGMLAKAGMNSRGVGVATNALVTAGDRGEPGIPYHVLLRSLYDAETFTDAFVALQKGPRSSSGNYLIAHADGIAADIEGAPGDFRQLYVLMPENGLLLHTNHFVTSAIEGPDVSLWAMPDSLARLVRARSLLEGMPRPFTRSDIEAVLCDHADYPSGLCCHPDPREDPLEQGATVLSIIMDPADRVMWLAEGNPCTAAYRRIDYGGFLDRPAASEEECARPCVDGVRRGPSQRGRRD